MLIYQLVAVVITYNVVYRYRHPSTCCWHCTGHTAQANWHSQAQAPLDSLLRPAGSVHTLAAETRQFVVSRSLNSDILCRWRSCSFDHFRRLFVSWDRDRSLESGNTTRTGFVSKTTLPRYWDIFLGQTSSQWTANLLCVVPQCAVCENILWSYLLPIVYKGCVKFLSR